MLLPIVVGIGLAQVQRPITWTPYEPKDVAITVQFPGSFHLRDDRKRGGKLTGAVLSRGSSGFAVMYCELPADVDAKTFLPDAWEKHIAAQQSVEVRSKKFDTWQGRPTYEGEYRYINSSTVFIRLMVDGRTLVQQLASWADSETDRETPSTFLASLKFKNPLRLQLAPFP